MTLAETDSSIATQYVQALVPPNLQHVFETVVAEHDLPVAEILRLAGQETLLGSQPSLATALATRIRYLLPLQMLQIGLLRAARSGRSETDPTLRRALLRTINGIATGLRNSG